MLRRRHLQSTERAPTESRTREPIWSPRATTRQDRRATIREDEGAEGISIGDATVWEGDSGQGFAKLTLTLDAPRAEDVFVDLVITDLTATNFDDFKSRAKRVRVRAGRVRAVLSTTVLGDTTPELDESFAVALTGTGASGVLVADDVGLVVIADDEPPATLAMYRPGSPTNLMAIRDVTDHELVHLTWTAPVPNSGPPTTSYRVVANGVPVGTPTQAALDVPLRSTVSSTIQVWARNSVGESILPATVVLPAG
ncbi:MAG: fibronectin type III domain-containing protein [Acidimicrobiia bacterium]|nr:fibronectin type III domain-containing protein [Acidimicrobiia bacterium]